MKADRVAFVCPRFADGSTVGGAETLLRNLADRAAAAGRKVDFLTTCARDHVTWENVVKAGTRTVDGMTVRFFPVDEARDTERFFAAQRAICSGRKATPRDTETWLSNSVNSPALIDFLHKEGPRYDRIVLGPYLFGLVYHAAQVHPRRSLLVPCLHDEPFAYLDCFTTLFNAVDGFMFNSDAECALAQRLYGIDARRGALVGMGIEPFGVDGDAFRERHGITAPYVIYSGRREAMKGTPILLDYLSVFRARTQRDIKFVLTGSGAIQPPSEIAPHVIDVGFVSDREKWNAMAGAAVFCHASVYESFGIVLMEAWQAGTPALVHAGGEVLRTHCARSGGGLWFRHYGDFEESLVRLLDDTVLSERMAEAGRAYVETHYRWDAVAARLLAALDRDPVPPEAAR